MSGGARVLRPETLAAASAEVTKLWGGGYGLGFNRSGSGATVPGQPTGTFGHGGLGGHLSFADPAAKMGFGYVCNLQV